MRSLVTIDVLDGRMLYAKSAAAAAVGKAPAERNAVHAADVTIGKRYQIHHTSGWVTVRVLRFHTLYTYGSRSPRNVTRYVCLNEKTGREIVVRSAAKFRKEVD